jgi:hypothetical protein
MATITRPSPELHSSSKSKHLKSDVRRPSTGITEPEEPAADGRWFVAGLYVLFGLGALVVSALVYAIMSGP